jgi:sulfate permease, SulP family
MLEQLVADLRRDDIVLVVARLKTQLMSRFESMGLVELIGTDHFYGTVQAAVTACLEPRS